MAKSRAPSQTQARMNFQEREFCLDSEFWKFQSRITWLSYFGSVEAAYFGGKIWPGKTAYPIHGGKGKKVGVSHHSTDPLKEGL